MSQDGQAFMTPHQPVPAYGSSWEGSWSWMKWFLVIKAISKEEDT